MKQFLFALLFVISSSVIAKSFTELSSKSPIKLGLKMDSEGYKNIHLLLVNKNEFYDSIPVQLTVRVGKDELIDYMTIGEALNIDAKTLYLYEGDSVSVELKVLSKEDVTIDNVKGNIKLNDPMVLKSEASPNSKSFLGEYWDAKQPTIFRTSKLDSVPQVATFKVNFNGNYPYDKFFYQINVMAPDSSFYSVEGEVEVNRGEVIEYKASELELTQQVGISKVGKYIIEVVPLMGQQRVNGIKSIGYQLVNVLD